MCLGTFSRRARSLATTYAFARVRILGTLVPFCAIGNSSEFPIAQKSGSPCPQYTFCRNLFLFYLSFEALATSPLSASSARTFGITISPLKKSAKDHTSSSFRLEPTTMQTTTIRE